MQPDACEKNLLREWNAFVLLAEVNEAQRGTDTLTQRPVRRRAGPVVAASQAERRLSQAPSGGLVARLTH